MSQKKKKDSSPNTSQTSADRLGSESPRDDKPNIRQVQENKAIQWAKENPKKTLGGGVVVGGAGYSFIKYVLPILYAYFGSSLTFQNEQFRFHVYCPVLSELNASHPEVVSNLSKAESDYLSSIYAIRIQDRPSLIHPTNYTLTYCGFLRKWGDNCSDAKPICTTPGAIFDVQAYQNISVIWINQIEGIDSKYKNVDDDDCHNQTNKDPHCLVQAKDVENIVGKNSAQCPLWTYLDPTRKQNTHTKKVRVSSKESIISTHLHGLEVEPAFDGHPLSWFSNKGSIGTGYFSYDTPYYDYENSGFDKELFRRILQLVRGSDKKFNYKINRYQNVQQPGTLWYHDHAMRSTAFNVKSGLFGFYIIRNSSEEKGLPEKQKERWILLNDNAWNDFYNTPTKKSETEDIPCSFALDDNLVNNEEYRFRILNGDFDKPYTDISFKVDDNQKIKFAIIGADSAVRANSSEVDQISFDLAPAERIDILIKFDAVDFGNLKTRNVALQGIRRGQKVTFATFKIQKIQKNPTPLQKVVNTGSPFINFTHYHHNVSVRRMRPLVNLFQKNSFYFGINGHFNFHHGKSENPEIGTVEDWYFINFMSFPHPLHVHLIQYQNVHQYSLKMFSSSQNFTCSFYQVDFYLKVAATSKQNCTLKQFLSYPSRNKQFYQNACKAIKKMKIGEYQACSENFGNEDEINKETKVSGIDVLQKTNDKVYSDTSCEGQNTNSTTQTAFFNKYVCQNTTDKIPESRKGYKETTLVPGNTVSVVRIRWAKSHMTEQQFSDAQQNSSINFFTVRDETLLDYPGFIYHCHILPHEDNEMMRPIMMQPHRNRRNITLPWTQTKVDKKNKENCENWKAWRKQQDQQSQKKHKDDGLRRFR